MTFIFPLLLGGLALIGVPVLLHLIMQQKPKHLLFPAFRFLLQRYRTNQRKLRLRHLLLLALRLLLIAGICLALARPKVFSERLNLGERPVAAVMLFDSSPSMEYMAGGQSRLEVAKRRAQELLDDLPEGSRVAILDTGDPGGQWFPTLSLARDRVAELRIRPANGPVTTRLNEAYGLFRELDQDAEGAEDVLPKFLYIFSDRAQNCWDQGRVKDLQQARDRLVGGVNAVLVDVGVESPADVALTAVALERQTVPIDGRVVLKVTVQATGADCDTQVLCQIDAEKTAERKLVRLSAGQSQVITFERRGLAVGPHRAEMRLETGDSLAFNNSLFATFEVRGGRRVLVIVNDPQDAAVFRLALETTKEFRCEVVTLDEFQRKFALRELSAYQAVCLLNVAKPDRDTWEKLEGYVHQGGGLAVIPAGESELDKSAYNDVAAQRLLPGSLVKVIQAKGEEGVIWKEGGFTHPIMAAVREWIMMRNVDFQQVHRAVHRYWEVERHPGNDVYVIASYDDAQSRPALLERTFDRKAKAQGRVLLFTTRMDKRHLAGTDRWNDYVQDWFYLALVKKTIGYLAGDAEEANFNYLSGQTVTIALPSTERSPVYTLQGPGLSATEAVVTRADNKSDLAVTQAVTPGNYKLLAESKEIASFSVNVPPDESQLTQVSTEQIEELLGAGSVLPLGHGINLHEALQGRWRQPLELFPWLMIFVLLVLVVENLLANKFYRRPAIEDAEPTADSASAV
jgi:hypothetical protein